MIPLTLTPTCTAGYQLSSRIWCRCRLEPNHQGDHQCVTCSKEWTDE